jgi:alkaline phosphatase D
MKGVLTLGVAVSLVSLVASVAVTADQSTGQPVFTDGVASGDVTSSTAILWTRVDRATSVKLEIWDNPMLSGQKAFEATEPQTSDANDFTVKIEATGLAPDTTYYYRFRHGDSAGESVSPVGTFKTPPLPGAPAAVRFTFTGDSDGTRIGGNPAINSFEVLNAVQLEHGDFFVYLGDTIYSDSSFRPSPAVTLNDYHAAYRVNRTYPNLTSLLASTSTYALPDDHEVFNNYVGQTVDPARYTAGITAFRDYMPVRDTGLPFDATCAGQPMFKVFQWGSLVDVIVLDERSCRSADVAAVCAGDLAPTLPTLIRGQFDLPGSPPPGCLSAINDPSRTLLGPVQKQALKDALLNSTAKFKFVLNEVPIEQFWALPYDRWEGYAGERSEILDFIRDPDGNPATNDSIDGVIFLTTDIHATLINGVVKDRFTSPAAVAQEVVTGPIAAFTFQQEIAGAGGAAMVPKVQSALTLAGAECRNLNEDSYAVIDVNASSGTATVAIKDQSGLPVLNQVPPFGACTKTFGQ